MFAVIFSDNECNRDVTTAKQNRCSIGTAIEIACT